MAVDVSGREDRRGGIDRGVVVIDIVTAATVAIRESVESFPVETMGLARPTARTDGG